MECLHLGKNAMMSVAGHVPQQIKHFALKRKPKSAALRAELLQKCKYGCASFGKCTSYRRHLHTLIEYNEMITTRNINRV